MRFPLIIVTTMGVVASVASAPANPEPERSLTTADLRPPSQVQVPEAPALGITREHAALKIHFTGILQSAAAIDGPWADVAGATSPWVAGSTAGGRQLFRSRSAETGGVLSSRSVVEWTLTGPMQAHFNMAFAGMPDGIFPPHREKPYFDGTLKMGDLELPVTMRVRGNSSLQECPFPKMKVKVSREDREGTPFAEAREIRIGTHCAEGGHGTIGRLREDTAAFREALAYEIQEALGFTGPRVRRARIDYRDPAMPVEDGGNVWPVRREALILDDIEVVAERLAGRALSDEEIAAITDARFDEQLLADLRLLHALLGNWDYALAQFGRDLWNTEVIELPGGSLVPVAGDFDLAGWVTGEILLSAPWDYRPELPKLERQMHYEIGEIRNRVGAVRFAAARDRFDQRRTALEELVRGASIDELGRVNAQQQLTAFFEALAAQK